ncbi:MAG: RluA family pseudouridine synthase [Candidatus Saccharibacteria bacterium]|nr:RluA family pseudouridine synthase [Candidatus Saccharibacteria bacterium]
MRLDSYLAQYFPEHSRSAWQKYILAGKVLVNGEVISSNDYTLDEDDVVTVDTKPNEQQIDIQLPVIYEDDNVIVINKPVGVLSHAKGGIINEQTVADFFATRTSFGIDTNRPGIVHRLDRATSGVMIGAKNVETAKLLQRQFSERKAKKSYNAIVQGAPEPPIAKLELPIERNPRHPSQFRVGTNGKSATTTYEVLQSTDKISLVKLTPETGRTHQLRVHMQYIKHPIVGDVVYGKPAERMFLHASSLEITIPDGQRKIFEAPLPPEFMQKMGQ